MHDPAEPSSSSSEGDSMEEDVASSSTPLEASKKLLPLLLQGANGYSLFTIDVEGRVTSWNAGAEAVFGWKAEDILGRSADILFTPDDQMQERPLLERVQAAEEGLAPDIRWHQRSDGGRVFISGSVQPFFTDDGTLSGFLKIGRDLTSERKTEAALQASEEKYSTLFETIEEGFLFGHVLRHETGVIDLRLEAVNPAFEKLTGRSTAHAVPRHAREVWPDWEEVWFQTIDQVAREGKGELLEIFQPLTGKWLSARVSPYGKEGEGGVAIAVTDITEVRRLAQEQLERHRQEALLEERTRMAQELHDTLAQALTSIKLQLELAEHSLEARNNLEEARRHLRVAREFTQSSQVESRRVVQGLRSPLLEESSLNSALRSLIPEGVCAPPVDYLSCEEEIRLAPELLNDVHRIAQEALTNALRHSRAAKIEIRLTATENGFVLEIEDDGDGMSASHDRAGFGIVGMRERAARIGAELLFLGKPGSGTLVRLTFSEQA